MPHETPYPANLPIAVARLEERVDALDDSVAEVRMVGTRLEGKLERLTAAVLGAALSFAVGSGAVVVAVMANLN